MRLLTRRGVLLGDADQESETRMSKNALRTGRRQAVEILRLIKAESKRSQIRGHGPGPSCSLPRDAQIKVINCKRNSAYLLQLRFTVCHLYFINLRDKVLITMER
ncbi:hypothetical protein TNCV_4684931 [Trichonephila clavipes]|nr:hypothetical protein TNCV_4684931 [Trichonephila clavipes]